MSIKKGPDATSPPPIPTRIWKIAAVTGGGAFIAMLDSTVANLAIESIRDDLNSTIPVIQWVASGYLIALAVSLPATGWLGNHFGHGRIWSASLAIFTLGSALCAIAPGPLSLIGARLCKDLQLVLWYRPGRQYSGRLPVPNNLAGLWAA